MIYKIELQTDVGSGMHIVHHLEQVIDDPEQAEQFGKEVWNITMAFTKGWGEAGHD